MLRPQNGIRPLMLRYQQQESREDETNPRHSQPDGANRLRGHLQIKDQTSSVLNQKFALVQIRACVA
jgi:hypothetical protein